MMRLSAQIMVSATMFISVSIGCSQSITKESEKAKLQGVWEVVYAERGGMKDFGYIGLRYEFLNNQFRIISKTKGPTHWKYYELNVTDNPNQMDWPVIRKMPDKKTETRILRMIYRIEHSKLIICSPRISSAPRPATFTSQPKNELLTLKRIPFADAAEEQKRQEAAGGWH